LNYLELNFLDEPMTTNNFSTRILKIGALMASCFLMPIAMANSPVGQWQTSDEKTGELKSVVIIFEQQGVMKGRVEKILRKDADPAAKCDKCSDDRKNQPVVGLEIIRGAKKSQWQKCLGRWRNSGS